MASERRAFVSALVRDDGQLSITHNWSKSATGIHLAQIYDAIGIEGSPDLQVIELNDLRAAIDLVCTHWWCRIVAEYSSLRADGDRPAIDPIHVYIEEACQNPARRKPIDHL